MLDDAGFDKLQDEVRGIVADWFASHRERLAGITADTKPAVLIAQLSEDFLDRFMPVPLLDAYDAYQQLMTYWQETMHDDVLLVMHEGWVNASRPRLTIEDKDRKLSETPDFEIGAGRNKTKYKMDLISPALIIGRYFAYDQARVDDLNAQAEAATSAVDEYVEEHGGDEGLLSDAVNDKGKLTQAAAKDTLREAKAANDEETIECAEVAIALLQTEAAAKKAAKEAQAVLDTLALKKYGDLAEVDVQALVLDTKWHATITKRIDGEVNALTLALVARIQQLGERYAETVDDLDAKLDKLQARVTGHLAAMGVES